MTRKIAIGFTIAFVITCSAIVWYTEHVKHSVTTQQNNQVLTGLTSSKLPRNAQAFEDKDTDIHNKVAEKIIQTAQECDRLHLSNSERLKRINAVTERGIAEVQRVRASHYSEPFNPNF